MANNKKQLVEIARSFSYKLNLGGYQTADFFCSQKAEVPAEDADLVSVALYEFCKEQVIKSVNQYKLENLPKPKENPPVIRQTKNVIKLEEATVEEGMQENLVKKEKEKVEEMEGEIHNL